MLRVLAWPAGCESDLNPYVRLMQQAFIAPDAELIAYTPRPWQRPAADVFHIQWPEAIFEGRGGRICAIAHGKAAMVLATAKRIRRRGGFVVLTLHNLAAHAALADWQRRLFTRFHDELLRRTDLLIALSQSTLDAFRAAYPIAGDIAVAVIAHPHYRTVYAVPDRAAARDRLGLADIAAPLVVIAGSLRPSKQVPAAIETFRAVERPARLLVAGEAGDAEWATIVRAAGGDRRVDLRRGQLSMAALADTIVAADAVLINQTTTLNSGTALLALSLGRPIIAPGVGALPELAGQVGTDWVRLFTPPLTGAALERGLQALPAPGHEPGLDVYDPQRLSREMLDTFVCFRSGRERDQPMKTCVST